MDSSESESSNVEMTDSSESDTSRESSSSRSGEVYHSMYQMCQYRARTCWISSRRKNDYNTIYISVLIYLT